jgi:hypothetical protein
MVLLYDSGTRALRVRALTVLSLLCVAGSVWLGIATGDVEIAGLLGAFALAFAIGMAFYETIYVRKLWLDEPREEVYIETLALFGRARLLAPLADCCGGAYYDVRVSDEKAPWVTLRVRGKRVPFIIDAGGAIRDEQRLRRVLGDCVDEWQEAGAELDA